MAPPRPSLSPADLQGFRTAVESLKLYRRADLADPDDGASLIEELYVDPLPQQDVFNTVLRPHTTFVIGRKGTGKSTVFQRLQHELRKTHSHTSAYLDIKTIYESSQPDQSLIARIEASDIALPRISIERIALYRAFISATIHQIQEELVKRVKSSIWERIKETFTGTYSDLLEDLNTLADEASEDNFVSVLGVLKAQVKTTAVAGETEESRLQAKMTLGAKNEFGADTTSTLTSKKEGSLASEYGDVMLRAFNINALLEKLKALLARIKIKHLYIIVDDFSELPEDAMKVVVDTLLAPLNNWSEEFIKFKIAAYPNRIYYGKIDRSKIDEIYLDLYSLFGTSDVATMENNAIVFTRRLVEERLRYFTNCESSDFFDGKEDEVWKVLFFASMANPRTLGYVLHFAYQNHLIHGNRIGVSAIQDAAIKYYEEKLGSYFRAGRFLHETFSERSSVYSLKELLEQIVTRARELRSHTSGVFSAVAGRPPTSHFHLHPSFESLFSTLELNFFVTKYFEMSDRDGRKVSVFALNYGLCQRHSISFGRPLGERKYRLYFVERVFDYGPLVRAFLEKNQEIVCDRCGVRQSSDKLDALRLYLMRCPECAIGTCQVVNLSRKYESVLRNVDEALLLPKTELGILQTLHSEGTPTRSKFVAEELDCSYQLVGKRAKKLEDKGLINRLKDDQVGVCSRLPTSQKVVIFPTRALANLRSVRVRKLMDLTAQRASSNRVDLSCGLWGRFLGDLQLGPWYLVGEFVLKESSHFVAAGIRAARFDSETFVASQPRVRVI